MWISVKDRLPKNSECVLITDGADVGAAHYFEKLLDPRTGEVSGPEWGNQHYRLTGRYIKEPTHWMPVEHLLKGLPVSVFIFDEDYSGPRFTYGLRLRPVARFNIPDGWIISSDRPHADYPTFGTVDYPHKLDGEVAAHYDMEFIGENSNQ